MIFKTNLPQYENDAAEIIRAFYESGNEENSAVLLEHNFDGAKNRVCINGKEYSSNTLPGLKNCGELYVKKITKRYMKLAMYEALSLYFGRKLPWGALTGVRPTKMVRELSKEGLAPYSVLTETFGVSEARASLACGISEIQKSLIAEDSRLLDLYIGIPFCVSRCSYCTFISEVIGKAEKLVIPYKNALVKELKAIENIIEDNGWQIRSVYVGGGTPTSFSAEQLAEILAAVSVKPLEFTVEAGRPDTITEAKLKVLKRAGVTRISVNPQTLKDETLKAIGRSHTADDFYKAFELSEKYGFILNTDLIAGLPGEEEKDFLNSLERVIGLGPDNITLHTLAFKRGSVISEDKSALNGKRMADVLIKAGGMLLEEGYSPYYMYRQKYMMDNLENVGYAKKGKECLYNVDIMEETLGIMAAGSGAISKRLFYSENRLERCANVKDVRGYIERIDELIKKKREFFKV